MGRQMLLPKSGAGRVQRELQVSTRLGITHCRMKMLKWKPLVPDGVTSKAFLCQEETHSSHSAYHTSHATR